MIPYLHSFPSPGWGDETQVCGEADNSVSDIIKAA